MCLLLGCVQRLSGESTSITRSLILAVSVCYHARLQNRIEFERGVAAQFTGAIKLSRGAAEFREEIKWCDTFVVMKFCNGTRYFIFEFHQVSRYIACKYETWP